PGNRVRETLSEIILGRGRDLMSVVHSTAIPNLYFVPSDRDLHQTDGVIGGKIGKEFILKGCMKIARTHFDYIIIDCPPNLGNLTLNALVASDYCIVPSEMSMFSAEAVNDFMLTIETIRERLNHDIVLLGILLTKVDRRNLKVNESVMKTLRYNFGEHLLPVEIPVNSAIAHSQIQGKPIILTAPESKGAAAYDELVSLVSRRCRGN
ncbi:MAG: ParA family protein, partial [Deltaproteobacteria bacterium]|nr:ParA family protein [Deltaproteobacteria bacterium]